jgi:hypothetical protein
VGPAAVGRNPAKTRVFTNSCSEPFFQLIQVEQQQSELSAGARGPLDFAVENID